MELSLPRRPPGRPFGSKDSRPRKKQRGHSSLDEQEELDEKNAELKWQTYKARIAKRFSMRSGQVQSLLPGATHVPPPPTCLPLHALYVGSSGASRVSGDTLVGWRSSPLVFGLISAP